MNKKGLLISLLAAFLCTFVHAQQDSVKVQPKAQPGIFSMKMQRRYVPTDLPFEEGRLRFLENTSISLSGGYRHWLGAQASSGPMATLALQKWLSPRHGLRLEAGSGSFLDLNNGSSVVLLPDVRLSHVFNLSAWLGGYDPASQGSLYTIGGAGYQWRQGGQGTWVAQLGLGYSLPVGRGIEVFAEPLFELDGNRFLQREDSNWRGYYTAFRGNVGISYRIDRWNSLLPPSEEHQWFITAAGAPVWKAGGGDMGYQLMLGTGQKTTPSVSLRISAAWTQLYRAAERASAYGALRFEALVDPVVLLGGKEDARWGLSLLAGPEAGFLDGSWDNPLYGTVNVLGNRFFYLGGSAGLQLRAGLFPRTWAFVEPRASFIPYSIYNGDRAESAVDVLLSAQLGIQYDIREARERVLAFRRMQAWESDRREREMQRKKERRERIHAFWDRTMPNVNFYVSAEGSYFRPLGRVYASGPLASLSLGTWITPMHGVLVNGGLGYFQDLKYGNGYVKTSDFGAAYLFNMTRFSRGEDAASRAFNISLLTGIGYMLPLQEIWDGSVTFRTGLDLRMHVLTRTDLVMRPEVNFLRAPSRDWTPALRGTFGLSYSMGGAPVARFAADGKEWYLFTGAGYQHEIVRLSDHAYEEAPLGEYRLSAGVGRRYTDRLDWRVSVSYLSQLQSQKAGSFAHRLRLTSVNLDALYKLFGDNLDQWKWSLSLVGGPEVGLQHKSIAGENSKGSGLILKRTTVSAYMGFSAGAQVKYHFTDALAAYLEPRYSIAPYVAITSQGEENYYTHLYGANLGLEYSFGWERYRSKADYSGEKGQAYTFLQATATAFRPFGRAYANGPIASFGVGHWFRGASGFLVEAGAGYFRDNQYTNGYLPQHMASIEARVSYLLSLTRLAARRHQIDFPVDVALIGGGGVLFPEFRQADKATPTFHGGFDFRVHILPGTDFVFQPQLEMLQDPHSMMDGSEKAFIGAFRGSFGLSYNWSWKNGRIPAHDPGKDWFVAASGGYQREWDRLSDITGEEVARDEYRISAALGRSFSPAVSLRLSGSYSKLVPQQYSFLHSVRYLSINGDFIYDLLAGEDGPGRVSLSLMAGPEGGVFNKNYNGAGNEHPMVLPIRVGKRTNHGIGAYIGLSAGTQVRVRLWHGLSAYLEQRYSVIPYVSAYGRTDHRNMTSQLWNLNLGLQYSFGNK